MAPNPICSYVRRGIAAASRRVAAHLSNIPDQPEVIYRASWWRIVTWGYHLFVAGMFAVPVYFICVRRPELWADVVELWPASRAQPD